MRRDVRAHVLWLPIAAALITLTVVETPRAQAPAPAQAKLTGVDTASCYSRAVRLRGVGSASGRSGSGLKSGASDSSRKRE